ncbi:MAG TPA: glycoside hydrolase, partial [Fimbriimonadaceae bacterium]|nr:glycoside hydrolase [Fimbriimonadaceae bacterium]
MIAVLAGVLLVPQQGAATSRVGTAGSSEVATALGPSVARLQEGMITLDPSIKYQKWLGWGTSLCWWGNVVGSMPAVREQLAQRIFVGLKLNIVRYNIGGGENPAHHHMQPRAQMEGFLGENGKYDWSRDAGQRWMLTRAKQLGVGRFEAFSNSPPWFMTISKCASGGKDGKPNLDPANDGAFAGYLAAVVRHFR